MNEMQAEPKQRVRHNYHMQWKSHANHFCTGFGSLLEHQTLVDVALCCGTKTIHAHKCVLAANSTYFRDRLSQAAAIEQIVFNNLDFEVVKCIIEYMYCGETSISEDNLKQLEAAANTFQLHGLQTMPSEQEVPVVEAPIFLSEKLKYAPHLESSASTSNPVPNVPNSRRKRRRDILSVEAETACAKEAAASRSAIDALNDDLAMRMNSTFVIEETCSETTVENFIPRKEAANVSFELQNYAHLNPYDSVTTDIFNDPSNIHNVISIPDEIIHFDGSELLNPMTPPRLAANVNNERFNEILGSGIPDDVEVIFKVTDGDYIKITEEMLQDMSAENSLLNYQVVFEDGQLGEVCDRSAQKKNSSNNLLIFDPGEKREAIVSNNYNFAYDTDIAMSDAEINSLLAFNLPNQKIGIDVAPRVNQVVNTDPFVNALTEIKEHLNIGDDSSLNKSIPNKGRNVAKCETQTLASLRQLKDYCDKESYLSDEHNTTESISVLPGCFDFQSVKQDINIIENQKVNKHDNEIEGNKENAKNEGNCELSLKKGNLETRPSPPISEEVPMEMFDDHEIEGNKENAKNEGNCDLSLKQGKLETRPSPPISEEVPMEMFDNHEIEGNKENAENEGNCDLSLKQEKLETRPSPPISEEVPMEMFDDHEIEGNKENAKNEGNCDLSLKQGKLETRPSPPISEEVPMEMFDKPDNKIEGNRENVKNERKCELSMKKGKLETRPSPPISEQVPMEIFDEIEGNKENAKNEGNCKLSLKKGQLETRPSPPISEEVPIKMFEENIRSTRYNLRLIKKVRKTD